VHVCKRSTCNATQSTQWRTPVDAALTCDGVFASMAFLGHIALEAVHAVDLVLVGGEASSSQSLTAGVAHKALGVPGLVLVADPS